MINILLYIKNNPNIDEVGRYIMSIYLGIIDKKHHKIFIKTV